MSRCMQNMYFKAFHISRDEGIVTYKWKPDFIILNMLAKKDEMQQKKMFMKYILRED